MKRVLNLLINALIGSGLLFSGSTVVHAQNTSDTLEGPKLRVAVLDLNGTGLKNPPAVTPGTGASIAPPTEFARGMTEMLTTALVQSNHFVVLERVVMDKITAEQDLARGAHGNAETAPGDKRIIGAQVIITGDITGFSYSLSSLGGNLSMLKGLGSKLGKQKITARVALDVRMVDAATGEALFSTHAEGKATGSNLSADLIKGGQEFDAATARDTPLGEATRQAMGRVVDAMAERAKSIRWSATVIDVRDDQVYINAGNDGGVRAGATFAVFHPGDKLIDPDTGQSLGAPETQIGSIVIDTVQDKYSVAKMPSGSGMKRGDVVRLPGQSAQKTN